MANHRWGHIVALGLLVLLATACPPRQATRQVDLPAETPPKPPISLTETPLPTSRPATKAEAIARGLDYLRRAPWEMEYVYFYAHLQLRLQWPELPAIARTPQVRDSLRARNDRPAQEILRAMDLFGRLLDPAYAVPERLAASAQELDSLTVPALYCDQLPVDTARYYRSLRAFGAMGGYHSTHALMALQWIRAQGCLGEAVLTRMAAPVVAQVQAVARNTSLPWGDLRLEAAALLAEERVPLPAEWVAQVMDAQRADGGWPLRPEDGRSDTHPTLLALWYLSRVP